MLILHLFPNTTCLPRRQQALRRLSRARNLTSMAPCCLSPILMKILVWTEDPGILKMTAFVKKDKGSTEWRLYWHPVIGSRAWCAGKIYMALSLQQILGGS